MSVIAVAAAKSSPGVSTVAELLALLWPDGLNSVALVDCDPSGSEWLLRAGVEAEPGLASLAMAGRRGLERDEVIRHLQSIGVGLWLVVGPAAARQATSALEMLGPGLADQLHSLQGIHAIVDCGGLFQGSAALPVLTSADLVVLVSRPTASAVVHLAPWIDELTGDGAQVAVVLTRHGAGDRGEPCYTESEVADALGVEILGTVDDDPAAAARLYAEPARLRSLSRSRLIRSMQPVAAAAYAAVGGPSAATPSTEAREVPAR